MKKCESRFGHSKRSSPMAGWGLVTWLTAQAALGQVPGTPRELVKPETNGQVPTTSAPPLVPAETAPPPASLAPGESFPVTPEPTEVPPAPQLPPVPVVPQRVASPPVPPEEPGRALRIGMSLLIGGGAGLVVGVGGGFVGAAAIRNDAVQPIGNVWTGAAIGFCIAAPVGVLLAGWLFDGDGAWWATVLGDLAGLAAGAAATLFGGVEGIPLLFVFPLAGSVLGCESSSGASRSHPALTPVATMGPGGGSIGLAGAF